MKKSKELEEIKRTRARTARIWNRDFNKVVKIINEYNLTKKEASFLMELYIHYLFAWFKGFDMETREKMIKKAEKFKKEYRR